MSLCNSLQQFILIFPLLFLPLSWVAYFLFHHLTFVNISWVSFMDQGVFHVLRNTYSSGQSRQFPISCTLCSNVGRDRKHANKQVNYAHRADNFIWRKKPICKIYLHIEHMRSIMFVSLDMYTTVSGQWGCLWILLSTFSSVAKFISPWQFLIFL